MPYIAIKGYPKDDETKKKVVDEINKIFMKHWGCPQEAISISIEEFAPESWEEKVVKPEINTKTDKMMIMSGKKILDHQKVVAQVAAVSVKQNLEKL